MFKVGDIVVCSPSKVVSSYWPDGYVFTITCISEHSVEGICKKGFKTWISADYLELDKKYKHRNKFKQRMKNVIEN